jgi:hypothetical protein
VLHVFLLQTVLHRDICLASSLPLMKMGAKSKMAIVGMLWHKLFKIMGKRGPKPVDTQILDLWDFDFHNAFRSLRDGMGTRALPPSGFTKQELRSFISQLKQITPEEYWLTTRRLSAKMGNQVNLSRPPSPMDRWWAEQERNDEIRRLERELDPPKPESQVTRRKVWNDLVKADTYAALRRACGRWAQLPDVWRRGMTTFPNYVVENAAQFLSMKHNKRFPRSTYGDDARIDYLARGMAGVLVGKSPLTGIERLRNLKHAQGSPLWVTHQGDYELPKSEQYCGCWRCRKKYWDNIRKLGQTWYENGLRAFMEVATTTKVPTEWKAQSKRLY